MYDFFKTYVETTDPQNDYSVIMSMGVLKSVIIHTIFYFTIYYYLFKFPIKNYIIIASLVVIMVIGYYGRLYRSKMIYKYHLEEGQEKETAKKITMDYMNQGYFKWYFLA